MYSKRYPKCNNTSIHPIAILAALLLIQLSGACDDQARSGYTLKTEAESTDTLNTGTWNGDTMEITEIPLESLSITIVYDNTSFDQDLESDWGFACIIDGLDKKILFDTGAKGELLLMNMQKLDCDPAEIEVVVLSHEHWDHVDGLGELLKITSSIDVFILDSFSESFRLSIEQAGARPVDLSGPEEICDGLYSTGTMGGDPEEQSVIITTDSGAIVITGCAHPGIVDIVRKARELTGQDILFVMGGFHLKSCQDDEVNGIIDEFFQMSVRYAGPCHCTGERQIELFHEAYGENFLRIGAGRVITAGDLLQ